MCYIVLKVLEGPLFLINAIIPVYAEGDSKHIKIFIRQAGNNALHMNNVMS